MKILKERTFNIDIVCIFTLLISLTVLFITSFIYIKNKDSTLELVHDSFQREALSVMDKTDNYLNTAQIATEIATEIFKDPNIKLGLETDAATYLLKVVCTQAQIDLFYFGDEQGNFLQAGELKDQIYLKNICRVNNKAVADFHYLDNNGKVIRKENVSNYKYDPRIRPWYKGAKATHKTFWTEPYIFFENGKPGITVACPVYNEDKTLKGVVAADITLDGLADFLKKTDISKHSIPFIIDGEERLLAYPEPDKMVTVENGKIRNLKPWELKIPQITEAVRDYEDHGKQLFSYEVNGEKHLACFTRFPDEFGKKWTFAIVAPEDDFLGPMKDTLRMTLLLSISGLIAAVIAGIFLSHQISKPIEQLAEEVLEVKNFNLATKYEVNSHILEIQTMKNAIGAMKNSLKAFQLYVPSTLVRQLIESGEDVTIGGKDRELTLFFSDIADFTTISESISPKDIMHQLSDYFDTITEIIDAEKGTLDKFIGDMVMAFWGAPLANDEHAVMACRAALKCKMAIDALNSEWKKEGKSPFFTRMGVHTGYSIVGNMGSRKRINYTAVGDNVNFASRLESVNKLYGTSIIITKATHRYVQNQFICRVLDQIAVKGKSQSNTIFELLGEKGSPESASWTQLADAFQNAYTLYLQREWKKAKELLQKILEDFPEDKVTRLYIERCQKYIENEPDESWNGITKLDTK